MSAFATGLVLAATALVAIAVGPAAAVCATNPVVTSAANAGAGTLREAVNTACTGSTITTTLPARTVISLSTVGDVTDGPSALGVGVTMTINAGGLIIERAAAVPKLRLFYIGGAGNLTLNNVTLRNGNAQGGNGGDGGGAGGGAAGLGGAIFNDGQLAISTSTLNGNVAKGGDPGAALNSGFGGGGGGGLGGKGGNGESSDGTGGGGGGNQADGGNAVGTTAGAGGSATGGKGASATSGAALNGGVGGGGGGGRFGLGASGGFGGGAGGGQGDPNPATGGFGGGGGGQFSGVSHPGFGGGAGTGGINTDGGGGAGLGGAIFNNKGKLNIANSTLTGNTASGGGLGGGTGSGFGGAVFNRDGTTSITASTLAFNTADSGGGVYSLQQTAAALAISTTILSNTTGGDDCHNNAGTVNAPAANQNLIVNNGGCGTPGVTVDPALAGLANNGGPTDTRAITTSSSAYNTGICPIASDQRGLPRPGSGTAQCDIGAFELQLTTNSTLSTQASTTGSIAVSGPVGGRVKDRATVSGANSPTGNITFKVFGPGDTACANALQVSSKPFVNGTIDADDFAPSVPGTYRWTAFYPGDANNTSVNSPCNAPNESSDIFASTLTSVAASPEPSVFGQSTTFTATVTARGTAGTPTGTVKFFEGATALTGDVPLTSGHASFNKSDLGAGTHTITATYTPGGGSFFLTSSGSTAHTVKAFAPCTRTVTDNAGAVTVNAGESVCITGASVSTLTVNPGGGVFVSGSRIVGNTTATQPKHFVMCGSSTNGSVSVSGATGLVEIGDWNNDDGIGCKGNTVALDIVVSGSTKSTEIGDNSVGRNFSFTNVTGRGPFPDDTAPELEGNRISHNIACSGNNPAPTNDGAPNRVQGTRSGQCTSI